MPFYIADSYKNPLSVSLPTEEQLKAYITWLGSELEQAHKACNARFKCNVVEAISDEVAKEQKKKEAKALYRKRYKARVAAHKALAATAKEE